MGGEKIAHHWVLKEKRFFCYSSGLRILNLCGGGLWKVVWCLEGQVHVEATWIVTKQRACVPGFQVYAWIAVLRDSLRACSLSSVLSLEAWGEILAVCSGFVLQRVYSLPFFFLCREPCFWNRLFSLWNRNDSPVWNVVLLAILWEAALLLPYNAHLFFQAFGELHFPEVLGLHGQIKTSIWID